MSQQTHFIPPLTIPAADDANLVWLAMLDYKYKMYAAVTEYRTSGKEDMAVAAERAADRADRLSEAAYVQYRDAQAKEGAGR